MRRKYPKLTDWVEETIGSMLAVCPATNASI